MNFLILNRNTHTYMYINIYKEILFSFIKEGNPALFYGETIGDKQFIRINLEDIMLTKINQL